MSSLDKLSKEHRELIEDACAVYTTHHRPKIAAVFTELIFKTLRPAGGRETTVREMKRRLWEEVALEKLSSASEVTILERGVTLRRRGMIVSVIKNETGSFDCSIEKDELSRT